MRKLNLSEAKKSLQAAIFVVEHLEDDTGQTLI